MKNVNLNYSFQKSLLLLFSLFLTTSLFSQPEPDCGFDESPSGSFLISGVEFFNENSCDPLYLQCSFVFLRRDNGTGSFPVNDSRIQTIINGMNNNWSEIIDPSNCSPDPDPYPLDANVRVKVDVYYIDNTAAWDWYGRAVSMGTSYWVDAFCPENVESSSSSTWPALKSVVNTFNANHPNTINFFFVENGTHLDVLEDAVNNQNTSNIPWHNPTTIKSFAGCAQFPQSYTSNDPPWILMTDKWTNLYARENFGTIYFPQFASSGNAVIASWQVDETYRLANHELGHTIMHDGHICGCLNLMIGRNCVPEWNPSANYLLFPQLDKMHSTIARSFLHKVIDCNELTADNCDVIINDNVTISSPLSIYGDLIIESGKTLTVTSEIYLSHNSEIHILENGKLIVNGGKLTSDCDDTWIGIKVTGGNSDFDVKFTNSAIIENTSSAAVSMFAPLPWPEIKDYGNGILQADNTTFNNTRRIVEMMAWSPSYNPSYIRDCVQNGGKWSVTNWNCRGVEISDNKFYDIEESAIVTEVGQFIIEDNKFYSSKNDILFANVSPGYGTIINHNEFYGSHTGIRALGTTVAQNRITLNKFENGIFNIFMDGDNSYWVESNDIGANFGIASLNNGNHSNEITTNDIDGSAVGLITTGVNRGYNFTKNCFDTDVVDSYLTGQLSSVISDGISDPANNCFTHQGDVNAAIADISGSPSPIQYVEPNDHTNTCQDALKAHANVTRVYQGDPDDVCSYAGTDFTSGNNDCNQIMNETSLLSTISSLNSSISSVQANTSLSALIKEWQIGSHKRCLKRAKWSLFEYYLREGDFSDARNLFSSDTTEDAKVAIFASYIFENELDDAGTYLSGLTSTGVGFNDFKWIQQVNLSRLEYGPFFAIASQKLDTVEIIANKTHIYAGYAKALFYHLTGELLTSDVPEPLETYLEPRGIAIPEKEKEILITPNPFTNSINISARGYENNLFACIYDIVGRPVFKQLIGSEKVVNTETWNSGLYVVVILSDNQVLEQKKLFLLR